MSDVQQSLLKGETTKWYKNCYNITWIFMEWWKCVRSFWNTGVIFMCWFIYLLVYGFNMCTFPEHCKCLWKRFPSQSSLKSSEIDRECNSLSFLLLGSFRWKCGCCLYLQKCTEYFILKTLHLIATKLPLWVFLINVRWIRTWLGTFIWKTSFAGRKWPEQFFMLQCYTYKSAGARRSRNTHLHSYLGNPMTRLECHLIITTLSLLSFFI
jgi:hypothetical protein